MLIAAAEGAAIGVAINGISNYIQEKSFFDGWGKAAVFGGVTGAISHSIGWVSGNNVGAEKWEISIVQGILHGWSGALITTLQGGNPIKGAISGFASSITAASIQSIGGGKVDILIGGTLSGGIGASVVGGNFYQGAAFGLISSSLNHLADKGGDLVRRSIVRIAHKYIGSKAWNVNEEKGNFGNPSNKCNKFVYDVLWESGADPGTPNGNTMGQIFGEKGSSPPSAEQWADPDYTIPGWEVVELPLP